MFTAIPRPQQTRAQRVFGVVKALVETRGGGRHGRSRVLARLFDLDSARFDLAVSRAKPLVFFEGESVGWPTTLSPQRSRDSTR